MKEYVVFEVRDGRLYKGTTETYKRPLPRINQEAMNIANISFNPDMMLCKDLNVSEAAYISGGTIIDNGNVLDWKCVMFKAFGTSYTVWMSYEDMSDADTFVCYHIAKGDLENAMFMAKHDLATEEELAEYGKYFQKMLGNN